jgi:hypothetical protein
MSRYLFDPSGRSFTVKNTKRDGTVVWRCTVRPKKDPCPAISWQQSGQNYHIVKNHICQNEDHKKIRLTILGEAKQQCKANNFASAASIAEPLLLKAVKANPGAILPGLHAVAAAGNRMRSKSRPKHPKDQFFDLDTRNLPKEFFR